MLDIFRRFFRPRPASTGLPITEQQAHEHLAGMAVPAVRIAYLNAPRTSKFGGRPELGSQHNWPSWQGRSLAFLAQIDLAELQAKAQQPSLPTTGMLYFFYDADQSTWGFDPNDRGSWQVLFTSAGDATSVRAQPADLDTEAMLPEIFVEFTEFQSYPAPERSGILWDEMEESFWEEYDDLRFGFRPSHQIGGYPLAIQEDYMELECQLAANGIYCGDPSGYKGSEAKRLSAGAPDWQLLLQLDSDDAANMMWGDLGRLYFWIRKQDLQAGDFSKVWMVLQCS